MAGDVRNLSEIQREVDESTTCVREYYFLKGQQAVRGQIMIIVVLVTRMQVRNMQRDLDILDYDSGIRDAFRTSSYVNYNHRRRSGDSKDAAGDIWGVCIHP